MTASVLISIYNEPVEEILESIQSILNQSFSEYELIIVHDNPRSNTKVNLLEKLRKLDERINIIENDNNIGLALSMNKAFEASTGEYLIRMDADDICEPYRFEKEIAVLKSGKCDLVFTNYRYIDEAGTLLFNSKAALESVYDPNEMIKKIYFDGIIHHPTVVMTRDIFLKAGGYRNFPCAQDQDLWIRMLECGCRFFFLNECLLRYRIRSNSITGSRKLQQYLTNTYIIKLACERLKKGYDCYSLADYNEYIENRITKREGERFKVACNWLQLAAEAPYMHKRIILRFKAFLLSKSLRERYIQKKRFGPWILEKFSVTGEKESGTLSSDLHKEVS